MAELQCNQQVVWRKPLRGGLKEIKLGTILAFSADTKKATVSFPGESLRRELPVEQLAPAQGVYGRARVAINPAHRNISVLR